MSYDEAIGRLQEIVQTLENGQAVSMDHYAELAKEAKKLIEFCRQHLTKLSNEINDILK